MDVYRGENFFSPFRSMTDETNTQKKNTDNDKTELDRTLRLRESKHPYLALPLVVVMIREMSLNSLFKYLQMRSILKSNEQLHCSVLSSSHSSVFYPLFVLLLSFKYIVWCVRRKAQVEYDFTQQHREKKEKIQSYHTLREPTKT